MLMILQKLFQPIMICARRWLEAKSWREEIPVEWIVSIKGLRFRSFPGRVLACVYSSTSHSVKNYIWSKYFSKDSTIIGIDINPDCKKFERDNIKIFIGNQSDENFWLDFFNKICFTKKKPDFWWVGWFDNIFGLWRLGVLRLSFICGHSLNTLRHNHQGYAL